MIGVSTFSANILIADNAETVFGNSSDLIIYHSSSTGNSVIRSQAPNDLVIGSNGGSINLTKGVSSENLAVFNTDGSVELYYDNSKKIETQVDGASITGSLTVSGDFNVPSGIGTIGNSLIVSNILLENGSISAQSGILTYYGDGSRLSNVIGGVGIATTGGVVGYGATILDIRGPGISSVSVGSGIGTFYITGGGSSTSIVKDTFTVTSSTQSTFTLSSSYVSGYIDVFLNGVKLNSSDYTETTSTSITLTSAAVNGDIVEIVNYKSVAVGITSAIFATNAFGLISTPNLNVGIVTGTSFDSGGTSSQFVKGDGSLDSNLYASTGKSIAMSMIFG